ncbi:uncharacterized protein LOC135211723 [Macrobrachium nipponense]|uniref:uncharacterized protein LOC135211723 n=1 Tax=Macrobrachium nipponense TaxID=159736 RepID=UPI0030C7D16C
MEFVVKLVVLSSAAVGLSLSQVGKEPFKKAGFRTGHLRQKQLDARFSSGDFNRGSIDSDGFGFGSDIHGQFGAKLVPLEAASPVIPILYEDKKGPDASGVYSFSFESADGTRRQESGQPTSPDTFSVQGSYSYISPEGLPFEVRYVADEFGFRAEGDHLPTPPPAPLHALQQIQAAEDAFLRKRNDQQIQILNPDPLLNLIPPKVNFQQVPRFQQRGRSLQQQTDLDSHHNSSPEIDHHANVRSHTKFEPKRIAGSP